MKISHPRQSLIAAALLQAFALHSAAQITSLPEVLVSAPRPADTRAESAAIGGFGDASLLQTPASISVITRQQMQDFGIRQTTDLMKVDASISDSYNAVGYAEQFSIRGFALDNATSYRKDGLPIPGDASIPLENKERVEILKGLAGLQAGSAAPGGIVNYVTKRPTRELLRSLSVGLSERGTRYGAIDLGGQSDDRRFGYRINAAAEGLRSYIKGANGERQFISGAFDWRVTPQALLQLDLDYQYKSQLTAPGFQLIKGTDLPSGIAADTMLNNQPWSKPVATRTSNIGLRFEYAFNSDWIATLAANRHEFRRDDFAAFPYGCTRENLFPGFCANGDYDVYDYQSTGERKSPSGQQAQIRGKFAAAGLQHELTAGVSRFTIRDSFGDYVYVTGSPVDFTSNIYRPVALPPSQDRTGPVTLRRSEEERAFFTQDVIRLSDLLTVHAGLRYTQVERLQFNSAGQLAVPYAQHATLPNVALVFMPTQKLALYGSFAEGMEHGGIAPLGTTNVGQQLDPNKSKQLEFGIKSTLAQDISVSAAVFGIRKSLEFARVNVDGSTTFVRQGDALHRGVELSATGKLTPALVLVASLAALDARQQDTGIVAQDGKRVTNVPHTKSFLSLDYALQGMPALRVNGSWQHASSKAFNAENSVTVPGYDVFNLGARYAMKLAGTNATLRFNVDNVFDKFYWRDATPLLGGYLFPGAPRTYKVAAQFDF